MAKWIPDEPSDEAALLSELGLSDIERLFEDIPRKVRIGRIGVAPGLDEAAVAASVGKILARNRPYSAFTSFLGGRLPTRFLPAAVDAILSRSEFYTSYTPYQPEASQGMLQALFEFQSLWVELTQLDVANASMYDGATSAGEAMLLCRRIHEGTRFLVPASLPWEERSVLANYGSGFGLTITEIPFDPGSGALDLEAVRAELARGGVFGMLADLPNGFGHIDPALPDLKGLLGSVPLVVVADPLALTVLEPPGAWGADIVVGEGQGFGAPPSFGGPLLGLFACRREHVRFAPGRIVGATQDPEGRRAYTLTLQTREQHIRRSRATSNICTNQSLLALAFVVYASVVGARGLARLQAANAEKARALAAGLGRVEGLRAPRFSAPFLADFAIEIGRGTATEYLDRVRRKKVLGGYPLRDPRPGHPSPFGELVLTSAHEGTDDRAIERYARAASAALGRAEASP
ncbi:MAG: aminomethyl-transferring glycine dehydrogenase subunit GcvPA [Thermoplasmata archaeon]|nr:aminomethyl-transferring glycine dehydrogenase subunit GcvPA [Thermoplasmata archaeon]